MMRVPFFLVFIFCSIHVRGQAISPDHLNEWIRNFTMSVLKNDSNAYRYFVSNGESNEILFAGLTGSIRKDSLALKGEIYSEGLKEFIRDSIINKFKTESNIGKIQFIDLQYVSSNYEVHNSINQLFPSLWAEAIVRFDSFYFKFPIKEAIFINKRWKVSEIGPLEFYDYNSEQNITPKISKFGTFENRYKIELIKIELVDDPPSLYRHHHILSVRPYAWLIHALQRRHPCAENSLLRNGNLVSQR